MRKFLIKAVVIGFLPSFLLCVFGSCGSLPQAYGLCIICHARDLVNFLTDAVAGAHFFSYGPFLSVLGIMVGGYLGARSSGGSSPLPGGVSGYFFQGFVASISALMMGMCTARMALLIGWGSLEAVVYLLGVLLGVLVWVRRGRH
jgi:hypothetical protein